MANNQVGTIFHYADAQIGRGQTSTERSSQVANLTSVAAMRTRLNAISSTTYSTARLDLMTKNDMLYAIRLESDATSIR